jgi:DnaJ domain/PilZ domain
MRTGYPPSAFITRGTACDNDKTTRIRTDALDRPDNGFRPVSAPTAHFSHRQPTSIKPCMWFRRQQPRIVANQSDPDQDPRRGSTRHPSETLSCMLGDVVDISTTGIRIRSKGKPPFSVGAVTTIKLSYEGGKLAVFVQERWRRRQGLRAYEMGLKFVNNSPNVTAAVESLVRFGFICPDAVASARPKAKKTRPKLRVTVDLPDYYAALGVRPDADSAQVHTAYRRLARRYHPDTNKDPGAQTRFISICEAYKVLSDPDQRKSYDLRKAG